MARPVVPSGIELTLHARQNGSDRINVIHVVATNVVPPTADLISSSQVWIDAIVANKGLWHPSVQFLDVTALDISAVGAPHYVNPFPSGTSGEATGAELPSNAAACISLHTPMGGRSGHGRLYHFGLTSGMVNNGDYFVSGSMTAFYDFYNGLMEDYIANDTPWAVFSRKLLELNTINSVSMDDRVDSQRRRLVGRGR